MTSLLGISVFRSQTARLCLFLVIPLTLCQRVSAQSITVRGQVDAHHISLADVRVSTSRSGKKATTDRDGKFTLVAFSRDTLTLVHPDFPARRYVLSTADSSINFYFDMADNKGFWLKGTKEERNSTDPPPPPPPVSGRPVLPSFPWPVPTPSAKVVLNTQFFTNVKTLGQADTRLTAALVKSGYPKPSYYQIPHGFAMAARIEQIELDGTPKQLPARWSAQVQPFSKFSLSNYFMLLFKAATGHFRVIVFLVTDVPAEKKQAPAAADVAMGWYESGADFLPADIRNQPFTDDYRVTTLIYEFEKLENSDKARLLGQSTCLDQDHLSKSMITANLTK